MSLRDAIEAALSGREVPAPLLEEVFAGIMAGEAEPVQIAGLLVALRAKGETASELAAIARALRRVAVRAPLPDPRTVDTCGTGGSGLDTFNVSTAAAFVVAGAGVPVAKHGNRGASSRSGSFDVLEALGVEIELPVDVSAGILADVGVGVFFARVAHPAFRHLASVRAALGVRTVMNCVGPLLNPVGARFQLVGVSDPALLPVLAEVLVELGAERALLVHGRDGMDEITTTTETDAVLATRTTMEPLVIDPTELGISRAEPAALAGGTATENAARLRALLDGELGPLRDLVVLNAAGALWAAGAVPDLVVGLARAGESLASGRARARLEALIEATRKARSELQAAASCSEGEAG